MSECDCPLMLVHCDPDDPWCRCYEEDLPDDDPIYEPQMVPFDCPRLGGVCYETACLHFNECRDGAA